MANLKPKTGEFKCVIFNYYLGKDQRKTLEYRNPNAQSSFVAIKRILGMKS